MRIVIETNWLKAIECFEPQDRLIIYEAIFDYLRGKEIDLDGSCKMAFSMIRPELDEEIERRERLAERSRQNGRKGGEKMRKKEPKEKKKGFESYYSKDKYKDRNERLMKFDVWVKNSAPYIYDSMAPLTQKEFDSLLSKHDVKEICQTIEQIENRRDLRKKYVSLYRTLLNWLKDGNT